MSAAPGCEPQTFDEALALAGRRFDIDAAGHLAEYEGLLLRAEMNEVERATRLTEYKGLITQCRFQLFADLIPMLNQRFGRIGQ